MAGFEPRVVLAEDDDFAECLAIRIEVFVHEQGVPEDEEIDDLDATATHLLARQTGIGVGTGRLVVERSRGRIGRMAVRKGWRGRGIGTAIVEEFLRMAQAGGIEEVYLAAQLHAIPFYERFGFVAEGETHEDGGLPHRWMRLWLAAGRDSVNLTPKNRIG